MSGVLLVHYHVSSAGHVLLVENLDVADDIVTRFVLLSTLVAHLHGEDRAGARIGGGVSWQEDDLLNVGECSVITLELMIMRTVLIISNKGNCWDW